MYVLCVFQPFLQFDLWNRSLNDGALFSLNRSRADRSERYFVSSLRALHSLSQGAPSLSKSRFAQERRAKERFQRAMCPALIPILCGCPETIFLYHTHILIIQRQLWHHKTKAGHSLFFQGSLIAKSLIKKQWFAIVRFTKTLNCYLY